MVLRFFLDKRGMSPLLVTIFLVAFAVALGAMVMSWGSNTERRDSSTCDDVSISPQVFLGEEMICFNEQSGKLKIVISNTGKVSLGGVAHRQIGSDFKVVDNVISGSDLGAGQVLSTELVINPGRVRVELIPVIVVLNERVFCSGKSLVRENIPVCK
jgi:FlaG/FlaF family flagellin (archaellin)